MPRRTTIIIQDDTYANLVQESIRRFGSARAISKVMDAMAIETVVSKKKQNEKELVTLLRAKRVAKTTTKEFERERRELSARFENRGL